MKPTLEPPGIKRLKLKSQELLSSFAFKFNSRRYILVGVEGVAVEILHSYDTLSGLFKVGRCRLTVYQKAS